MSTEKQKGSGSSSDLTEVRKAFSTSAWTRALDYRVRQNQKFFNFLWDQRVWILSGTMLTLIMPVLQNDNTLWLSYSRSANLYGFDLLVPMLSSTAENNVVYVSSFSVNPMALIIYGLAALHLYLIFVRANVSARLALWHGIIQTLLAIGFPFLDITTLNLILPHFNSYWHVQPPLTGFWLLVITGLALWGAAYGRILRGISPIEE
jgi:hypothetical protein